MREFKFRAWDKEDERMYYSGKAQTETDISRKYEFKEIDFCKKNWWVRDPYINVGSDYNSVIMQWTGLKDKNGKEIYEGDIVKLIKWKDKEFIGIVEYFEAGFALRVSEDKDELHCIMSHNSIEVIGDIFQNPELIK